MVSREERDRSRSAGRAAIASGSMGIFSFGSLITAFVYIVSLHTDFEKLEDVPLLGRLLFSGHNVGILLQALCMIPVVIAVHHLGRRSAPNLSRAAFVVGLVAYPAVVLLEAPILVDPQLISDIFFMGPMGFVGVWLVIVNWLLRSRLSRGLFTIGMIAGIGFVIVGLSFFFLLDLPALLRNPDAYGEDVDFHIGLWIGGIPAFILFPIWAIFFGRNLLRAEQEIYHEHWRHHFRSAERIKGSEPFSWTCLRERPTNTQGPDPQLNWRGEQNLPLVRNPAALRYWAN